MKFKAIYTLSISIFLLLIIFENSACAQNWPMLNYDKERTSWAKDETVLHPPLEPIGEINIKSGGTKLGDIAFYNQLLTLAVQNEPNTLEVHDIVSKDTLWTFKVPNTRGSMSFTCAQNDSIIFAGGQQGLGLYALHRETGEEKWHKPMGTLYTKNVIIDGDRLYILGDSLYCLSILDGATVWAQPMVVQSTPAVDDYYVYVTGKYKVQIFDKMSGEPAWERPTSERTTAGIAVDEMAFYTHSNDTVYAYNKESRTIKWFYHSAGDTLEYASQNSISITDNKLCFIVNYNGQGNGQLVTLDKNTGEFIWEHTFSGNYVFAAAIANGVAYVVPFKEAALYGFDLENGEQVFYDNSVAYRNQPIVANHQLYASSIDKVIIFGNVATNVDYDNNSTVQDFKLLQNYPNPFNPTTNIEYQISNFEHVSLKVYDVTGRIVATLVNRYQPAGDYQVTFNAKDLASGVYIYQLSLKGKAIQTRKMILVK